MHTTKETYLTNHNGDYIHYSYDFSYGSVTPDVLCQFIPKANLLNWLEKRSSKLRSANRAASRNRSPKTVLHIDCTNWNAGYQLADKVNLQCVDWGFIPDWLTTAFEHQLPRLKANH